MERTSKFFYLSNGTTASEPPAEGVFFIQENREIDYYHSRYSYQGDRIVYAVLDHCVKLYDLFQNKIFTQPDEYYKYIDMVPIGLMSAGLDSDVDIPRQYFERYFTEGIYADLIKQESISEDLAAMISEIDRLKYRYAYVADCQSLTGTLQELILATNDSFIGFYKLLCNVPETDGLEGTYFALNSEGRLAFNMLHSLIIQVYSILDITTKIVYELEHLKECTNKYEKLASKGKLFGDKKDLTLDKTGTIFEKCRAISIFENLRNELIHNATWEMYPKVFFIKENGKLTERVIHFPDFNEDGNLVTYKNRKRFFADGKRVNEELPLLYLEVMQRLYKTVSILT